MLIGGYIKDQVRCIEPELISELQRAVEDVTASITTEMPYEEAKDNLERHRKYRLRV